jgi:hypothetical protein
VSGPDKFDLPIGKPEFCRRTDPAVSRFYVLQPDDKKKDVKIFTENQLIIMGGMKNKLSNLG